MISTSLVIGIKKSIATNNGRLSKIHVSIVT